MQTKSSFTFLWLLVLSCDCYSQTSSIKMLKTEDKVLKVLEKKGMNAECVFLDHTHHDFFGATIWHNEICVMSPSQNPEVLLVSDRMIWETELLEEMDKRGIDEFILKPGSITFPKCLTKFAGPNPIIIVGKPRVKPGKYWSQLFPDGSLQGNKICVPFNVIDPSGGSITRDVDNADLLSLNATRKCSGEFICIHVLKDKISYVECHLATPIRIVQLFRPFAHSNCRGQVVDKPEMFSGYREGLRTLWLGPRN